MHYVFYDLSNITGMPSILSYDISVERMAQVKCDGNALRIL